MTRQRQDEVLVQRQVADMLSGYIIDPTLRLQAASTVANVMVMAAEQAVHRSLIAVLADLNTSLDAARKSWLTSDDAILAAVESVVARASRSISFEDRDK